jgi:hypothetical protein
MCMRSNVVLRDDLNQYVRMYECVMHVYTVCPDQKRVEIPKTRDANDPVSFAGSLREKNTAGWLLI